MPAAASATLARPALPQRAPCFCTGSLECVAQRRRFKFCRTRAILDVPGSGQFGSGPPVSSPPSTWSSTVVPFCYPPQSEQAYLEHRTRLVRRYFPNALGIEDFMQRVEVALYAYGFSGDNSIAMVNLCRDEVTLTLKQRIDRVFGSSFNTNGLGGVLTCGVSGVKAGLSHAPVCAATGAERYVFFSFPHISIDARGVRGAISRPGRPGQSCACGALRGALEAIRGAGLGHACKVPGVHEPLDPEMTILLQRLARRLKYEGVSESEARNPDQLDLVRITQVAERTITDDLEYLISQTVDAKRADYAVITGVQIHSWSSNFDDEVPNFEFVAPSTIDVVTRGVKTHIDLLSLPALTPRQVALLAADHEHGDRYNQGAPASSQGHAHRRSVCGSASGTTVREVEAPYMYRSPASDNAQLLARLASHAPKTAGDSCPWPGWQSRLRAPAPHRADDSSVHMDHGMEGVAGYQDRCTAKVLIGNCID